MSGLAGASDRALRLPFLLCVPQCNSLRTLLRNMLRKSFFNF
jgi:hypothetical protein